MMLQIPNIVKSKGLVVSDKIFLNFQSENLFLAI